MTLIREGHTVAIIDPGMVADRSAILHPLEALGVHPDEVTDVVFSHHHPDHTVNAALFLNAQVHDVMATYEGDVWTDRDPQDAGLGPSIRLLATPGHTDEDVSTLVETGLGLVVLTHLWWSSEGPADDPFARDRDLLRASRESVLALGSGPDRARSRRPVRPRPRPPPLTAPRGSTGPARGGLDQWSPRWFPHGIRNH